ncbi:MAG: FecR family protein [Chthonomonadaceae bacterium]|nr:FecR family protein [Chthonomonadaceae bacterium]
MLAYTRHSRGWLVLLGLLIGVGGTAAQRGIAQQTSDGGYAVSETGEAQAPDPVPDAGTQVNTGPVRLARIAFVQGNVTWRTDDSTDWSTATVNIPLRQGAQIWVTDGGRAEIQFDDGSLLRVGTGAVMTLQTLYSDSDGEFTELKMTGGLASLRLRHDHAVYQVNTPLGSIKAAGPAALRIGIGNGLEVAVQSGKATLEGAQGKADLQGGDFLDLADSNSPYTVRDIPRADSWDRWNKERDDLLSHAADEPATQHLPADIAIVAQDLNDYGTWRDDSEDGWVWCPRVSNPEWRPYHDGHWTWVNPFGWTWVSSEAWGWAPYHYGTWVSRPYGWAWCPGPVNQYWSPAVVHFTENAGTIGWCPLAPREVRYPTTLAFGFRGGNWATYFSIGGCAVYYPTTYGYCAPRVYNTTYVNRVTYVTPLNGGVASITRFGYSQESYAANHNTYLGGNAFIPLNSRKAAGVTAVASAEFGGRGAYLAVPKADTSLFVRGRAIGAPPVGAAPLAGPIVKPTPQALTPTRTFTVAQQAGPAVRNRPVFRAPAAPAIVRNSAPITPTGRIITQPQNGYINPRTLPNASGNVIGNGRSLPNERTVTNPARGTGTSPARGIGTTGQDPVRNPVAPRSNNGQNPNPYPNQGRYNNAPQNGGSSPDRRSPGTGSGTANSAAEAAAAARASLGSGGRNRPTGSPADGSVNTDRTNRSPQYNGPNGAGSSDRTPRPPQYNGSNSSGSADRTNQPPRYNGSNNTGNVDRTPRTPSSTGSGNSGSSDRTTRPPQYNGPGSPGSADRSPRPPQYNGSNGSGSNGSSTERSAPSYTPRQPQPQNAPPRSEPPRSNPPAREPDRTPPARQPEKSTTPPSKDSGSDSKGTDTTNHGRGRG